MISSSNVENYILQKFIEDMSFAFVLQSSTQFDIQGVHGKLHTMYLEIEGFSRLYAYSGSCVVVDMEAMESKRLYFDLCPNYEYDERLEYRKMQREMFENVNEFKKKLRLN